ncbi:1,4-alpha-glucan branching protein GlgB [Kocuria tytonis]|uniref:1,4-alpha-glucan branching enzyme GlgB n=1 Tax=Kocuria tytonis TaxID=2054280 RepID=A0A495A2M9_9MICC|nr:1,4-alpha-glucan branching protein GlgB [Kocuria tytonis]RKQ33613.1 1,4-alpha-glucan branching protein GlgB [Kocuria tytonis]
MTDQQVLDRLREWLPRQRWFPFTATPDQLRLSVVGRTALDGGDSWVSQPGRERIMFLVQVTVGERNELLSVPVVRSTEPLPELEQFLIGSYPADGSGRALPEQLAAGAEASASVLRRAVSQAGAFLGRRRSDRADASSARSGTGGSGDPRGVGNPEKTPAAGPDGSTADSHEAAHHHLYDAVAEPGFMDRVLRMMDAQLTEGGVLRHGMGLHGRYTGALNTDYRVAASEQVRVISSEQSNTSVILRPGEADAEDSVLRGDAVIVKFFRVVGEGRNPDVEVGVKLTSHGSSAVPATAGWIDAQWRQGLVTTSGQLAVAAQFLDDSRDAWAMAVDAATAERDFTDLARDLGATTARVHADLVAAFEPAAVDDDARRRFLEDLAGRIRWAWESCGERFAAFGPEVDALLEELSDTRQIPALQRIHGDYHLGQVLHNDAQGFRILDFEGEPLRPIKERVRPDVALRDVVGMLRSFDYAGAMAAKERGRDTAAWTRAVSEAFLEGYSATNGARVDMDSVLFRALWLDKALYEVVYEQRNRPEWVQVPADAVVRSLERARSRNVKREKHESHATSSRTEDFVTTEHPRPAESAATPAAERPGPTPSGHSAPRSSEPAPQPPAHDAARQAPAASDGSAAPSDPKGAGNPAPGSAAAGHSGADRPGADAAPSSAAGPAGGPVTVSEDVLAAVAEGRHHDPHSVLGAHPNPDGTVTIRTLRRFATAVSVRTPDGSFPLEHEWGGIFTGVVPAHDEGKIPDYRVEVGYAGKAPELVDDPYRFAPTLGELDLHLIGEGRHETLWEVLGAHVRRYPSALGDVAGVSFAVWAPNARAVRVIGDFNGWDGSEHAMRALGSSGVWELFVPGMKSGDTYKYQICGSDGAWRDKADPMAFGTEIPPSTASRVFESDYQFQDAEWMAKRAAGDPHNAPMSVYEMHIGSWRMGLGYVDLARELVEYLTWQGFTHVEFMPVAEHPFGGSWGYQVTGYYAPSSRFGSPDEFRYLVDQLHQAGIGVLVDWVPGHFPKDEWALAKFDGQPLYEHPDPRRGEHKDWGTLIFDYGRREVRNFLVANASYWLEEFHVDGLRVDAVASMLYLDYSRNDGEWEPNQYGGRENLEAIAFLQEANATAYRRSPGIVMIAEESTSFPGVTKPTSAGGLGFGIKWNMGWMHDSLEYMAEDPINRHYHHNKATFSLVYAFSENFILPISHDEVVYGKGSLLRKMPGDRWQQLANVRAYLAYMWAHPGKQLIFMGTEYAQESEWSQEHGLDWWLSETPPHHGVQELVRSLNTIYRQTPALYARDNDPSGFEWIDANDAKRNTLSFTRWDDQGNPLVCVTNFAGNTHEGFRLGLPWAGEWEEVLNTDSELFGGSGVGNLGRVTATEGAHDGKPASTVLTVPPLAVLFLKPAGGSGTSPAAGSDSGNH